MDMEWNQVLTFSEMVKDPVFLTGEITAICSRRAHTIWRS